MELKMTDQPRPRVLTGLRANSSLTIANYLGAILPMARLIKKYKDTHDFFMFVPDLHSFITPINHDELYQNTIHNVKVFVAAGAVNLKNDHLYVYRQSHVPAHSELTWVLDCFTYMGELSRMTQFKDKAGLQKSQTSDFKTAFQKLKAIGSQLRNSVNDEEQPQHESVNVGLFNYPVLMAADILLYSAMYIPVGEDQRQHIELTRDLGLRLNEKFKDVFPEGVFQTVPVEWKRQLKFSGLDQGLRIRSLRNPDKKMSKSDADPAGYVTLLDTPQRAAKKIMAATTDSEGVIRFDWGNQPGITNLLQMLALLSDRNIHEVVNDWQGKTRYGDLKQAVATAVGDFLESFQTKLATVDESKLLARLEADEAKARDISGAQLRRVQQAVGLYPRHNG
jgi:tryptophanyl-tRNA synthetase